MQRGRRHRLAFAMLITAVLLLASACRCPERESVTIDGSSTVYPISEAVAEEFLAWRRSNDMPNDVRITIGVSGTGGGFEKFCGGELDVTGASRPIKPIEVERCEANGISYLEIPVAYDGVAVVVNPQNDWVDYLTVDELRRMWEPEAQNRIMSWSDIREGFPDEPLRLFGAGVDSGTYDYFTKAIVGTEHASRGDYTSSEDDNVLVQGVGGSRLGIGYFGFAYYDENRDLLRAVPIVNGDPAEVEGVLPTVETIGRGTYDPLARPIFVYVRLDAMARRGVSEFMEYYLNEGTSFVRGAGYIPLPEATYELARERLRNRVTGSIMAGAGSQVGVDLAALLTASNAAAREAAESEAPTSPEGSDDD